jgi:hypothetical protein
MFEPFSPTIIRSGDVFSPPDMRKENIILLFFIGILSVGTSVLLIVTDGNIFAASAFLATAAVVLLTLYRLDIGLYLFVGSVLVFDQYFIPGFHPLTFKVSYFKNLKEITYLPTFSAGVLNPLELHLLLLIVVWMFVLSIRKDIGTVRIRLWALAIIFYVALIGWTIYGLKRGGEFLVAMWELRALFYLGALYFLVPQIIQTKRQLRGLVWVCIAGITFKALQGCVRFASLHFSLSGFDTLTNHEDPLFMLSLLVLLFGLVMFNAKDSQRWVLIILLFPLMMGFYVAQRRAAYAAVVPMFAVFTVMLGPGERMIFFKALLPILLVLGLYTAVFWNSESRFGSPVRLVKSGLSDQRKEAGERYYSNLYRELEKFDLAKTVQQFPVFGIGFGNKYEEPIPLVKIEFPLRHYIPHDEDLWVIVKTGAVGFFLFWFFFDSFAFRAAFLSVRLRDPYFKAVVTMIVAAIAGQMVVSYFDLQLTYYRNMVYLGVLMGMLHAIERMNALSPGQMKEVERTMNNYSPSF